MRSLEFVFVFVRNFLDSIHCFGRVRLDYEHKCRCRRVSTEAQNARR